MSIPTQGTVPRSVIRGEFVSESVGIDKAFVNVSGREMHGVVLESLGMPAGVSPEWDGEPVNWNPDVGPGPLHLITADVGPGPLIPLLIVIPIVPYLSEFLFFDHIPGPRWCDR